MTPQGTAQDHPRALGLCLLQDAQPLPHLAVGRLAVLIGRGDAAARLDQCLDAHNALPAFLPFAPRHAPGLAAACQRAEAEAEPLARALAMLTGMAEMILTLDAPGTMAGQATREGSDHAEAGPGPGPGRQWLRQRAARQGDADRLRAELARLAPEALPIAVPALSSTAPDVDPGSDRPPGPAPLAEAALLLSPLDMPARARVLTRALTCLEADRTGPGKPSNLRLRCTGPWPAFAAAARLTGRAEPVADSLADRVPA